ncbi:asparaginyl/glutamyl-tRNA amidotransferase subunit C [Gammaproteobacteria bacterium 42_54_T18]|nr:asparaginyl/glutamyl-tRNA amidotransferase subunit C [Gammaproteobacteria bacterium 42_54_T18]
MALDKSEVEKIAHLARIAINEDKIPEYASSLSNILDLVEQMQSTNTDDIEPMAHPLDATQRLRDDAVTENNQRDAYQKIAPATEDGLYLVPKVID